MEKVFEKKPNIVLLVMDTARAANYSTYGYEKRTDLYLKEMADQGIKFENAISNSIWTLPSHYSIFTGLLPSHHQVTDKDTHTTSRRVFTEDLESEGYRTIGVSSNAFVSPMYGFKEMFEEFKFIGDYFRIQDKIPFSDDKLFQEIYEKEKEGDWDSKRKKYSYFLKQSFLRKSPKSLINGAYYLLTQNLPDLGEEQEDDGAQKANEILLDSIEEEPFFGFINYVEPHDPYSPPRGDAEEFLEKDYEDAMKVSEGADLTEMLGEEDQDKAEILKSLYDGEIKYLDRKISELKNKIEQKTDRETVFIITSDHGENFENGLWGHYGKITEELIHVPMVVSGAGKGSIEENFSLRKISDLITNLAKEKKFKPETSEKVITEYWGLRSHNWHLDEKNFDEEFLKNQKSLMQEELTLWKSGEKIEESVRNFIQMRCGSP